HDDPWVEAMLGFTYRSKADFKVAIRHFERAYRLRPSVRLGYELGATRALACDLAGADSSFAATDNQFPNAQAEVPPEYRAMREASAMHVGAKDPDCGAFIVRADSRAARAAAR
ncbi:MAG: hypothetical protein HOQ09_13415, partial [Gemmatimonadaceae bacterium]|nr:hypothetical protein [Gemmatimonadaceae bacterium]